MDNPKILIPVNTQSLHLNECIEEKFFYKKISNMCSKNYITCYFKFSTNKNS